MGGAQKTFTGKEPSMNNICQIEQVTKTYWVNGSQHTIFDGLSMEIATDEITVVLGKSGCGKTTLLRLMADLEMPTKGTLRFYDQQGQQRRPRIGVVFQEPRLMPWLDVKRNITFHQEKPDWQMADGLIKLLGLDGFADAYPDALSGGMASRVAIARALAYQPELLLMDEPFAALDYFTRLALEEEMIGLYQRSKVGIIFVTHDVDEALLIGQRLILMKKDTKPYQQAISQLYPRQLESTELQDIKRDILQRLKD